MDISFHNVKEIKLLRDELPSRDLITIIIKHGNGLVQEIELTGNEYDQLPIVFE